MEVLEVVDLWSQDFGPQQTKPAQGAKSITVPGLGHGPLWAFLPTHAAQALGLEYDS